MVDDLPQPLSGNVGGRAATSNTSWQWGPALSDGRKQTPMRNSIRFFGTWAWPLWLFAIGCTSRPNRIEVPSFDPDEVAARALAQLDSNSDGSLSREEIAPAKSFESSMSRLDKDGDGKLSAEEIAARIEHYIAFRAGLVPVYATLSQRGRPLVGATVTYEPEKFMGDSIVPATGVTDSRGAAVVSVAAEHLPSPRHSGARPGFYMIRVTMPDGTQATKLDAGVECAGDLMNTHTFAIP